MTLAALLPLIVWAVPKLVSIAEGIFSWKAKSGADKKQFVTNTLQGVVGSMQQVSTGGQKETWDNLAPAISMLIEGSVAMANAIGAFDDENAAISRGA